MDIPAMALGGAIGILALLIGLAGVYLRRGRARAAPSQPQEQQPQPQPAQGEDLDRIAEILVTGRDPAEIRPKPPQPRRTWQKRHLTRMTWAGVGIAACATWCRWMVRDHPFVTGAVIFAVLGAGGATGIALTPSVIPDGMQEDSATAPPEAHGPTASPEPTPTTTEPTPTPTVEATAEPPPDPTPTPALQEASPEPQPQPGATGAPPIGVDPPPAGDGEDDEEEDDQ